MLRPNSNTMCRKVKEFRGRAGEDAYARQFNAMVPKSHFQVHEGTGTISLWGLRETVGGQFESNQVTIEVSSQKRRV